MSGWMNEWIHLSMSHWMHGWTNKPIKELTNGWMMEVINEQTSDSKNKYMKTVCEKMWSFTSKVYNNLEPTSWWQNQLNNKTHNTSFGFCHRKKNTIIALLKAWIIEKYL